MSNVLLDQSEKGVVVPPVFVTFDEEAFSGSSTESTKNPFTHNTPTPNVLSFPKLGFINFNDVPRTADFSPPAILQ